MILAGGQGYYASPGARSGRACASFMRGNGEFLAPRIFVTGAEVTAGGVIAVLTIQRGERPSVKIRGAALPQKSPCCGYYSFSLRRNTRAGLPPPETRNSGTRFSCSRPARML
jgi:hypothetical protein